MKISKNETILQVNILKEGKEYIAYSPALDISSCGKSEAEAKRNLGSAVKLFLDELQEMGTLDDALFELGWRKADNPRYNWIPPQLLNSTVRISLPRTK